MTRLAAVLFLLLALVGAAAPAAPQSPQRMNVSLVPETEGVLPGGTVTLAFVMRPAAGWHGYWRNPGDAGAEPRVDWRLPAGWTAEPLQYPVPDRLLVMGLMNYVYEHDYALLVNLKVPETAEPGVTVPVDARLDYLVCTSDLCVPETANVSIELHTIQPGARNPAFGAWRQALPRPLSEPARFQVAGNRLRIAIPFPQGTDVAAPYFFPVTADAMRHSEPQTVSRSGPFLIVEAGAGAQAATLQTLDGVIAIDAGTGLQFTARPGDVPTAGAPIAGPAESGAQPDAPTGEGSSILLALLGALIGGLILNVMPCVFPILSLKALSLARVGADGGAARREALAYAAGVIGTCLALGGVLLAVRAGGAAAGWAFQLQDPRVILLLLLLVTAIALNLAGLFQLPALTGGDDLARSGGTKGAFFTGALAAFIATPCTGPFLGFALGAALVLPTWAGLAVFAGLGLGLALPFLLLGFVPALRNLLPKPGAWMETLQRILSVPMFLTALGLVWVLGRQAGVDGMTLGLAAALLLGLGLWWLGRKQGGGRIWLALAVIAVAVIAPLPFVRIAAPAVAEAATDPLGSEPFSEARLAELRAAGTPTFVYFTADWCITCKVNERAALEQDEVAEAFRAKGVRVLVGDWTRGDEAIGRFLERHGRSGVPFYLYYAPDREPEVLPQILTVGRLTALGA